MTLSELQRAALVLWAAKEAGPFASLDQMKALCHVMRNRVAAGWHDGDWFQVLQDYEAPNEGAEPTMLTAANRPMQMLARDVDEIFYGHADDEIARVCGRQDKERGPLLYWCSVDRPITLRFKVVIVDKPEQHFQRGIFGFLYLYE